MYMVINLLSIFVCVFHGYVDLRSLRGTQRIVSAEYLLAGLNRLRYSNLIAKKLEISLAKHHRLS